MLVSFGVCLAFTMQLQLPFSPLILSVIFLGAYTFCMWWLLRRERWSTLCALLLLTIGTAWLHTYQVFELPPGLNDDEIKTLKSTHEFFGNRKIFVLAAQGPILHAILFQMPIVWWTDSAWWAMRLYPIVFGILAVTVSFSVGRSLRFGIIPSFVTAALVATLPWSLFWGRISWGGEIIFYQALLLAALGRILWCDGGKVELVIGAIGLSGLLWDYTGAWSMLAMPFIAALIGHTLRQRALSLGVFALAVILWIPYLLNIQEWWQHISNKVSLTPTSTAPLSIAALQQRFEHLLGPFKQTLRVFLYPEGNVYWISMHSVAIQPTFVLAVAALGSIVSIGRRSVFLGLGFLAGLTPALLSFSGAPSTHRMMCAFLFISIACAAPFWFASKVSTGRAGQWLIGIIAVCFVGTATKQSVALFFSPSFWTESERIFFGSETLLTEGIRLPTSTPLAAGPQINRILDARGVEKPGFANLTYETLLPTRPSTIALSPAIQLLIPFYEGSLPKEHITTYGTVPDKASIKAEFSASDVEYWGKYGWTIERRCADRTLTGIRLPTFYVTNDLGWMEPCPMQRQIIFRAKWTREPTQLSLLTYRGTPVTIETSQGLKVTSSSTDQAPKQFTLHPNEIVTISVESSHGGLAWLMEGGERTSKLPRLESFQPVP